MRLLLYEQVTLPPPFTAQDLHPCLERIAGDLDHRALVTTVSIGSGTPWRAASQGWKPPADWAPIPDVARLPKDVPPRFPCIAMRVGADQPYPCTRCPDWYGWHWGFHGFADHLAGVFA